MTGKVRISYNIGQALSGGRCEAFLYWKVEDDLEECIVGHGDTYEAAKNDAIDKFKSIPPSEELEIE